MDSLFFIIKSFILTVVLVLILQIKFGGSTVEERLSDTMHSVGIVDVAQTMADGAMKTLRNGWRSVTSGLVTSEQPGNRASKFNFDRSAQYVRETSQDVKKEAKDRYKKLKRSWSEAEE